VTLEEAFAELGIDRDAGSDGARRSTQLPRWSSP
jgi:hypothetical protein